MSSSAAAEPLELPDVISAFNTFIRGATHTDGRVVAPGARIVDVYYNSPTSMTVFFEAQSSGRYRPGTIRAVYTASDRWLWTSGNFGSAMSGWTFKNPTHFGNPYVPVR